MTYDLLHVKSTNAIIFVSIYDSIPMFKNTNNKVDINNRQIIN